MHIVRVTAGVRVLATSGSLGPEFGCLGLAHNMWGEVHMQLTTEPMRVHILGESRGALSAGNSHLIAKVMKRSLDAAGLPQARIELNCCNGIAQGGGLGSSMAVVIAELMLVRGLANKSELFDGDTVLRLATKFEGHLDNAAPAFHGGIAPS